jgi:DEAD/DEAH box helicase domain-containing protein
MNILPLLSRWRADASIAANILAWEVIPAQLANFASIPDSIHPSLIASLNENGINKLYRHQVQSWKFIQKKQNIAVVTGTASGKTMCYNLPVLDRLIRDPVKTALYLFPTKALAQDQLSGLQNLISNLPSESANIGPATYDGDLPLGSRPTIRKNSRLIITNPDMLHTGILPHHARWERFFKGLCFIIIDEIHTYRGVFGSHVANTLRRLKRITSFYGTNPTYILTSATIGNPKDFAEELIQEPITIIHQDGSARGEKHFIIYNPPIVNEELGIRVSLTQETQRLIEDLLTYKIQSIIFGRTRRTVELLLRSLKPKFRDLDGNSILQAYRSGYLPKQRRSIERGLREGHIQAVIATTALELGIDIGQLGASLIAGYPGTIAGTWQQAGRAGRGADSSLVVLVTSASPLDQFIARHPDYFFRHSPEDALINPDNLLILLGHIQCAVYELPFNEDETFGNLNPDEIAEIFDYLQNKGAVYKSKKSYFWLRDQFPAANISLRSASPNKICLQTITDDKPITIGEIDRESASWMVHPEAIYLHQGETYFVNALDLNTNRAQLSPIEVDYYTRPQRETEIQLIDLYKQVHGEFVQKYYGEILVTTQVTGYRKTRWGTNENIGFGNVTLPPSNLTTTGYWLSFSDRLIKLLQSEGKWNSSPNYYGANWQFKREQVRERDHYSCQFCGLPEHGKAHHVHHIRPFRSFTTPELANQLDNLITLCPSCHLRAESAVKVRSGLSGLAYALVNIAPVYLMCDPGDIGLHVDPQSRLTDGMPTIVLFDGIPAGIGFSQRLFDIHDKLLRDTQELINGCQCLDGCPSCVGPGGEEGSGGKKEALAILNQLINLDSQ